MPATTGTSPTATPRRTHRRGVAISDHRHLQRLNHRHLQRRATRRPGRRGGRWTAGVSPQPCALELTFESGVAQAGADMPLTAIPRSGDLDQLTTHARLAVGRPAVTVPEDLAGSSRYRPPPRRPASRTAALPARNGPPASKRPSGTRAHKLPSTRRPRRESSSSRTYQSFGCAADGYVSRPPIRPERRVGAGATAPRRRRGSSGKRRAPRRGPPRKCRPERLRPRCRRVSPHRLR